MTLLLDRDDAPAADAPRTFLPVRRADDAAPVPRTSVGALPLETSFLSWGARFAALGLSWVIVERLLPIHGFGWFVVVAAMCNLALLAVGTLVNDNRIAMADRVAEWVVSTAALIVFLALVTVLVFVFKRGWPGMT